jgi:hypothetical protein
MIRTCYKKSFGGYSRPSAWLSFSALVCPSSKYAAPSVFPEKCKRVSLDHLDLTVDTVVPIALRVLLRQDVHVKGGVTGRVQQTIEVPISERLAVPLQTSLPVGLQLDSPLTIELEEFVPITIQFDETLPVRLQSVGVSGGGRP